MSALRGQTHADNEAHGRARVALLNCLATDDTVVAYFDRWRANTALGQAATHASELLDELAQIMGFKHRGDLWSAEAQQIMGQGSFTITLEEDPGEEERERLRHLGETVTVALEALSTELDRWGDPEGGTERDAVVRDAIQLVRDEWHLDYPWLSMKLFEMWFQALNYGVVGRVVRQRLWYVPPSPLDAPAPSFTITIESGGGEPISEVLASIDTELAAIAATLRDTMHQYDVPDIPNGKTSNPEVIERYIQWFYRVHIHIPHESINHVATTSAEGDRSLIKYGLKRAKHWLSLSSWSWKDPGENNAA